MLFYNMGVAIIEIQKYIKYPQIIIYELVLVTYPPAIEFLQNSITHNYA